jgi:hypothetical protein
MVRSTSSGPAPGKGVKTIIYGGLISGYRSTGRLTNAKPPSPISRANIIRTVVGRETTVLAIIITSIS